MVILLLLAGGAFMYASYRRDLNDAIGRIAAGGTVLGTPCGMIEYAGHGSGSPILVVHGASDLVTPYFENQLILDQLPPFASPDRLKLSVYGGGHMFYSRDVSRKAFRDDAREMYRATEQVLVPPTRG